MVINKNNGNIIIEEIPVKEKQLKDIKTLKIYKVIVKDLKEKTQLEGNLKVMQINNNIKYRFTHNTFNNKLVEYIVQELKKYKYIK